MLFQNSTLNKDCLPLLLPPLATHKVVFSKEKAKVKDSDCNLFKAVSKSSKFASQVLERAYTLQLNIVEKTDLFNFILISSCAALEQRVIRVPTRFDLLFLVYLI